MKGNKADEKNGLTKEAMGQKKTTRHTYHIQTLT